MKIYRRHEDAQVASADPVSENIKAGAVAGTIIVVTLISRATGDVYDLTKAGIKKVNNWICGLFKGNEKADEQTNEKANA